MLQSVSLHAVLIILKQMLNVLIDNSPSQMGQQVVTLYNYTGIALSPSDVAFFHFFPIALEKQHTLAHAGASHR